MIKLSQSRDGGKKESIEGWREACFMGNGFREELGGACPVGGKQPHCPPPPPSKDLMDNISEEFALIINGHSLV